MRMRPIWITAVLILTPLTVQAFGPQDHAALTAFYNWWTIGTGAVFALVFYFLWRLKKQETLSGESIEGILWFSRALAVWCLSGIAGLVAGAYGMPECAILFTSVFSTINSVFILLVIPSIDIEPDAPDLVKQIVALSKNKLGIIVGGFMVVAITALGFLLFRSQFAENERIWHWLYVPDILFSLFTVLALLLVFKAAFHDSRRQMSLMVWVVYLTIFLTMLSEIGQTVPAWGLPETFIKQDFPVYYNVAATLFKMLLIMLFTILLYSFEIKKAAEHRVAELLSDEEIRAKWGLEQKETIVLRRLARGETREAIGSDHDLFPPRGQANAPRMAPRKNVDDLLQNKIAPKLRLPNQQQIILLFALENKIIQFEHPGAGNFTDNISGDFPAEN